MKSKQYRTKPLLIACAGLLQVSLLVAQQSSNSRPLVGNSENHEEQICDRKCLGLQLPRPDFNELDRQNALRKSLGVQQEYDHYHRALLNPFGTPIPSTLYLGSGDADGNGIVDRDDYVAMLFGTRNLQTDLDADGQASTTTDLGIMESFLNGDVSYLPAWWEYFGTEEERIARSDSIIRNIDDVDQYEYTDPTYVCRHFSSELHMRAVGYSGPEVPLYLYDVTRIGIYNYPLYMMYYWPDDRAWGHAVSCVLTGEDITNINDLLIYEPQDDSSRRRVPLKTGSVAILGINYFNPRWDDVEGDIVVGIDPYYLVCWEIEENGNDSLTWIHSDLILERPAIPRNYMLNLIEEKGSEILEADLVFHHNDTSKSFRILDGNNAVASFTDSSLIFNGARDFFGHTSIIWEVSDAYSKDTGYVDLSFENIPDFPIAAARDTIISAPGKIALDGSISYHPDYPLNQLIDYRWIQLNGPETVPIANADSCVAFIDLQEPGLYAFELTVFDSSNHFDRDTLTVDAFALHLLFQDIPVSYSLYQNYPNPFNPLTQIQYSIPTQSHVRVTVYDLRGREISTILDTEKPPGRHKVIFDGSAYPSGIYIARLHCRYAGQARLVTPEYTKSIKMVLLK
ncbi:T9SS type A sorting domain-containing protein [Candidatus Neomarinimicrobiota bacterium]